MPLGYCRSCAKRSRTELCPDCKIPMVTESFAPTPVRSFIDSICDYSGELQSPDRFSPYGLVGELERCLAVHERLSQLSAGLQRALPGSNSLASSPTWRALEAHIEACRARLLEAPAEGLAHDGWVKPR